MRMLPDGEPIAFVIREFPMHTERFVLRELFALLELGFKLRIYTMERKGVHHDELARRVAPYVVELPSKHSLASLRSLGLPTKGNLQVAFRLLPLALLAPIVDERHIPIWRRLRWLRWHLFHLGRAIWLASDLAKFGITRCHAHFGHVTASIALFATMPAGVRFSFTAHAYDIYVEPILMRRKIANASFAVTCTRANFDYLKGAYSDAVDKLHLVYHGLLRSEIAKFAELAGEKNVRERGALLFVGRLVPKKGVDVLLRALARLRGKAKCVVVGDGPMRQKLEMLARQLKLCGCVTFVGSVRHADVAKYYARAAALIVPSVIASNGDRDGLPNVILEAAASSLPIIASNISGIPEFVEDGESGLLFPAGDDEALAEAIGKVLSDDKLARKLAEGAYQKLLTDFVAEENALRLGNLFLS
ncbi:MAG: glycosyltransferase [Armatimonadota bacterium]|nr:glycosyltransferase [Armatimonadota bacterium]MCX7778325.1 glycosyltransferase [Armatimonadota bacterium]MDW8026396.1 glycosyltransferase [Armatimonadota bacterium]